MKLGFMGTEVRIERVKKVLAGRFPELEKVICIEGTYEYREDIADKLREISQEVDGFLFCGKLQYEVFHDVFDEQFPCGYLKKDDSALKTALLTLQGKGIDINRISIDNYSYATIRRIYEASDLSYEQVHLLKRENFRMHHKDYYSDLLAQHRNLYEQGKTQGALTTLSFVYESLKEMQIPCAYIIPSYDSMILDIQHIIHICEKENDSEREKLCCLIFHLSPDLGNSVSGQNAYLFAQAKLRASEELSYFAQQTHAMVIAHSDEDYSMICQVDAFMKYTRDLHIFPLFQLIHDNCRLDYFAGIGFGDTPADAGLHAKLALKKALHEEHDGIFICYNPQTIYGPLEYVDVHGRKEMEEQAYLEDISRKTGISAGKLKQLLISAAHSDNYTVTVKSLSEDMNISVRAANRLLNHLEEFHLVEAIGKVMKENAGRPANVFRILMKIHP